jgi:hypothetical protein
LIDRAFAHGELDGAGNPTIRVRGADAGELARDIVAKSAAWGITTSHEQALATANETIARIEFKRTCGRIAAGIAAAIVVVMFWAMVAHAEDLATGTIGAKGTLGCPTEEDTIRLRELAHERDKAAFITFAVGHKCDLVFGKLFIEKSDGWNNTVCVRPYGNPDCVWTIPEDITREEPK